MKKARPATGLGFAALFGAACGCLMALLMLPGLGANPTSAPQPPSPIADAGTDTPTGSNNYIATNANAIWGRHEAALYSTPVPPDYSTLPPVVPITRTEHGYTLTLYPMYASANLIVLTYSVQLPPEGQMQSSRPCGPVLGEESPCGDHSRYPIPTDPSAAYNPRLTDENGRTYPWLRENAEHIPHDFRTSELLVFDARQLTAGSSGRVKLRLELNVVARSTPTPNGGATVDWIAWPFRLDFTLPVERVRRVAEVNQTIDHSGTKITIERVIVTRYDVRIEWHVKDAVQTAEVNPFGHNTYACCHLVLRTGEKSAGFLHQSALAGQSEPERTNFAAGSFMSEEGTWEIKAWYYSTYAGDEYYGPRPGPVFRFLMPPATD
jgi:hypothetical protein